MTERDSKSLVKVSEESITKIPFQALQTFREEYPDQTLAKRFRINHTFIEIDSMVRYSILALIKGGYIKQSIYETMSCYDKRGILNQNPSHTEYSYSLVDKDQKKSR